MSTLTILLIQNSHLVVNPIGMGGHFCIHTDLRCAKLLLCKLRVTCFSCMVHLQQWGEVLISITTVPRIENEASATSTKIHTEEELKSPLERASVYLFTTNTLNIFIYHSLIWTNCFHKSVGKSNYPKFLEGSQVSVQRKEGLSC